MDYPLLLTVAVTIVRCELNINAKKFHIELCERRFNLLLKPDPLSRLILVARAAVCSVWICCCHGNVKYGLLVHSFTVGDIKETLIVRIFIYLHLLFDLWINPRKTFGNSYWFAKGSHVCVCVCVIQQRAQMCEWNQLRSRSSEAAVVSFSSWALLHGWWVWLGDRLKRAGTTAAWTSWPASNENPPFWSFSCVTIRRSGHRSSEVPYFFQAVL